MKQIDVKMKKGSVVITVDGREFEFPKFKGFIQIAEMMAHADEEIFCTILQLDDMRRLWDIECRLEKAKNMYDKENDPFDTYHSFENYVNCPVMDQKYINNIKQEALMLFRKKAEAEEYNDIGKVESYKAELERISDFVLEMLKPDKTSTNMPDEYFKPADAVRKSVGKALGMIGKVNLELQKHLKKQIKIGRYSCYRSLPSVKVTVKGS